MKTRKVKFEGKYHFVCQYTGAPCSIRFFIPVGKNNRKERCFATLPVLLRSIYEEEGEKFTPYFEQVKIDVESYFNQPDIPLQQKLSPEMRPLSEDKLFAYLEGIECGAAWLLVPNGEVCKPPPTKKRKIKV
jgi:hypothetical protein